jgi:hypothetical protein
MSHAMITVALSLLMAPCVENSTSPVPTPPRTVDEPPVCIDYTNEASFSESDYFSSAIIRSVVGHLRLSFADDPDKLALLDRLCVVRHESEDAYKGHSRAERDRALVVLDVPHLAEPKEHLLWRSAIVALDDKFRRYGNVDILPRDDPSFAFSTRDLMITNVQQSISHDVAIWLLMHEIAHHTLGTVELAADPAEARRQELEADTWAFAEMDRMGMSLYFVGSYFRGRSLDARLEDNPSDIRHPSFEERWKNLHAAYPKLYRHHPSPQRAYDIIMPGERRDKFDIAPRERDRTRDVNNAVLTVLTAFVPLRDDFARPKYHQHGVAAVLMDGKDISDGGFPCSAVASEGVDSIGVLCQVENNVYLDIYIGDASHAIASANVYLYAPYGKFEGAKPPGPAKNPDDYQRQDMIELPAVQPNIVPLMMHLDVGAFANAYMDNPDIEYEGGVRLADLVGHQHDAQRVEILEELGVSASDTQYVIARLDGLELTRLVALTRYNEGELSSAELERELARIEDDERQAINAIQLRIGTDKWWMFLALQRRDPLGQAALLIQEMLQSDPDLQAVSRLLGVDEP